MGKVSGKQTICGRGMLPPESIRRAVLAVYEAVGRAGSQPPSGAGFPTGAALARELGYPEAQLERLSPVALDAFVGVAALGLEVAGEPGDWVADLGCGAGVDALILADRGFRVIGLDGSASMLARLKVAARAADCLGVVPLRGLLPSIPLRDGSVGWVVMNGVANLVPDRRGLLRAAHRVLPPGGRLLMADLLAIDRIPEELQGLPEAWAWCVAGATDPETWEEELRGSGFEEIHIDVHERFPPLARAVLRASRPQKELLR
jgi:SAM-dependent methyltransferase